MTIHHHSIVILSPAHISCMNSGLLKDLLQSGSEAELATMIQDGWLAKVQHQLR